jgi:probable HAF family extracellular repeat protein
MLRSTGITLALGMFVVAPTAPSAAQETYVLTELKAAAADSGDDVKAYAISGTGQIVGLAMIGGSAHSAYWLNNDFTDLHGTTHLDLLQRFTVGWTEAYNISDGGQIVGTGRKLIKCDPDDIIVSTAMLLRPAVLTDLGTPYPGDALTDLGTFGDPCFVNDSAAVGISNQNHIVGWSDLDRGGTVHAFLVTPVNGAWFADVTGPEGEPDGGNDYLVDLGTLHPRAVVSSATAVNDSGVVVGYSYTGAASFHAFRVVPNNGEWFEDDGEGANALMEDLGTLGGTNSWARGINNAGQIVGESDTASLDTRAFLYENGVMTDLGTLGGANSSASSINEFGAIVGWAETASGERHAAAWVDGGIIDLNEVLLPNTDVGAVLTEARDINSSGQIAGWSKARTLRAEFKPFLLRIATAAEIVTAEEEEVGDTTSDGDTDTGVVSGTSTSNGGTGSTATGDQDGVPLDVPVVSSGENNNTANGGLGAPALCGAASMSLLPLTILAIGSLRLRRR